MTPAETIEHAISSGAQNGIATLSSTERAVWLISEAETLCDMEGIDSFLSRYSGDLLLEAATAFHRVGAVQIGQALRAIHAASPPPDELLTQAETLICGRVGYDYDAILKYVSDTA
jgi:hypothetical protein